MVFSLAGVAWHIPLVYKRVYTKFPFVLKHPRGTAHQPNPENLWVSAPLVV
jgi:hypothetical protein